MKKISAKTKSIIADRTVELVLSIASAWELAIKISKDKTVSDDENVQKYDIKWIW